MQLGIILNQLQVLIQPKEHGFEAFVNFYGEPFRVNFHQHLEKYKLNCFLGKQRLIFQRFLDEYEELLSFEMVSEIQSDDLPDQLHIFLGEGIRELAQQDKSAEDLVGDFVAEPVAGQISESVLIEARGS